MLWRVGYSEGCAVSFRTFERPYPFVAPDWKRVAREQCCGFRGRRQRCFRLACRSITAGQADSSCHPPLWSRINNAKAVMANRNIGGLSGIASSAASLMRSSSRHEAVDRFERLFHICPMFSFKTCLRFRARRQCHSPTSAASRTTGRAQASAVAGSELQLAAHRNGWHRFGRDRS